MNASSSPEPKQILACIELACFRHFGRSILQDRLEGLELWVT
jgi:hypothetical protein